MNKTLLCQSMIDACKELVKLNFVYGTWGNISVRYKEGMLITPSRVGYDEMTPDDIVFVKMDGSEENENNRHASSEKNVHRLIYAKRDEINAIVHCHSTYATAVAAMGTPIPPVTEEMCQLIGGGIPVTSQFIPSSHHMELGEMAATCIGDKNALLLCNHGPVCCGFDLDEAMITCRVAEKAALIYISTKNFNAQPIDQQWVDDGRDYYLNRYGKEN